MLALIRRHQALAYFSLTIVLSWAAVGAVIWPGPVPAAPAGAQRLFPFVYLAMLVGPPVAGLVMTALTTGTAGLRDYGARLMRWRVGIRWYAVALFTAPLVLCLTMIALAPWSRDFLPGFLVSDASGPIQAGSAASYLALALAVGVGAGVFEELGWTGFAIPTMRSRFGVETTGLLVGLVWGAWHGLAVLWGSAGAFGSASVTLFMVVALFSFLPPYRILMAMVWERTRSTLVGILMHASLTTYMIVFRPSATGNAAIAWDLAFAGALWIVVAGATHRVHAAQDAGAPRGAHA